MLEYEWNCVLIVNSKPPSSDNPNQCTHKILNSASAHNFIVNNIPSYSEVIFGCRVIWICNEFLEK